MADDIKIKLGLDTGQLFADLSKVTTNLNQVAISADKAEVEIKQLDAQKVDIDTSGAKKALDNLAAEAKTTGGGIMDSLKGGLSGGNLASGLVGGLAGGLATAGIGTAISAVQGLGTAIFDGAMRADEFGDKLEVAFSQQGIADIEGEINKVRESTLQLANDLGLPTQRTRELASTVATLGGVSGKQAEELTKLSAGIETFTDGTVKGEAVVKAFSRGLADPEGAAAIESLSKKYPQLADTLKSALSPTEKLAAANKILGTSFDTVKAQQADAGGTFNKLSNSVNEAFETIGSGLNNAINVLIPIFTETLGPTFEKLSQTIGGVFERIWSVLQPILALIGGAIIQNIVVTINGVMVVIDTLYQIWTTAFDAIVQAFDPLVTALKDAFGVDGALGEGSDMMQMFTDALGVVTDLMSEVGGIVADLGGLLVQFLITPIELLIGGITNVVKAIADWMGANDDNNESIKKTGEETEKTGGFVNWLRTAFDNIRGTIGGVTEAFKVVKGVIYDFFTALTNFDLQGAINAFSGFGDKVAEGYRKGFNEKIDKIKNDRSADKLAEEAKKAEEAARKTLPKGGGKGGGTKTPKETESDLQELKRLYADYAEYLLNNERTILQDFKGTAEERKNEEARLSKERAQKLKEYLNTQLADVKDFNANLSSEQLALKIKPDKAKKEDFEDIRSFYLGETSKLSKDLNLEVKVKLPDFKATIKDFETAVKDVEKNTENLVPKVLANSQEALDANTSQITKYLEFIKSQSLEIEQAKTEALASGNIEAAESFDAQIQRNVLSINTLTSKLATYQTDSSKAIAKAEEEATLGFQLNAALSTSILDAFNSERLAKERETNKALRDEKLGALDAEENDLTTSLAKREISFEDYAAKMSDIDKARQEAMEATEVTFAERFKEIQDKTIGSLLRSQSKAISGFVEDQFKDAQGNVSATGKIIGESMTSLTGQFAALAESGKATLGDFGNAAAGVAFDTVQAMVPSFIAGILGSSITALGPIFGPIAAGLATASLQLLLGAARAALGFKDGVVDLEGPGTETSDSIPAWLSKGESVMTASTTKANKEELAWMNSNPGLSIRDYFTSHAPQVRYSVNEDGGLIREVQKLREETRGLGRQINRNTHVSISGELRADNNSIKAVIDTERRRNARRG